MWREIAIAVTFSAFSLHSDQPSKHPRMNTLNLRMAAVRKRAMHAALMIAMCFPTVFAMAQDTFEGHIEYAIKYVEMPEEMKGFESMLPSTMHMRIKGKKARIEQDVLGGSQVVVADDDNKTGFVLMDMMGQKIAVQLSKEEFEAEEEQKEKPQIKYLEETKTVAGYTCHKAMVTDANGTTTLWYTKELGMFKHKDYETLDGFPLEYETAQNNMHLNMQATVVEKGSVADNLFTIPDGYQVMSMDDLKGMMGE